MRRAKIPAVPIRNSIGEPALTYRKRLTMKSVVAPLCRGGLRGTATERRGYNFAARCEQEQFATVIRHRRRLRRDK
jgi:hypothetical protein